VTTTPATGPSSEPDVVDVLTTDHHEVLALIGQISGAPSNEARRDMADTAISEVVRHAIAEEMYVYPAMKEHLPEGAEEVEHDIREHKELETVMKNLEGVDPSDPQFDALVREFEAKLSHHANDEETDQFPKLRASIPREKLVELAGKVETAKKLAPTRPHPAAPNNQLFHKLVGPGVGLVDRLRDKITGRSTG
jgi:hemerythrin superfamily protein